MQFGVQLDESLEAERAERPPLSGDDRDHRQQLTGRLVDWAQVGQRMAERFRIVGQGQLDGIDGDGTP
jgi:hypothetical protein